MSEGSQIGQRLKAFCANCKGERNCEIKGHHLERGSEQEHYDWWTNWYLLVCCGCDHVFAESRFTDSESSYPIGYDGDGDIIHHQDETIKTWPPRFKRDRPTWLERINGFSAHARAADLEACLFQVYEALDHDLNILAAIGIRTTFDVASEILGVDPDLPFEGKLQKLLADRIINPSQRDDFDVLINAGNASAHRGWNPTFEDLNPLVDSLEHFLADQFVTPHLRRIAADGVAKTRPKVPKRVKKTKQPKGQAAP